MYLTKMQMVMANPRPPRPLTHIQIRLNVDCFSVTNRIPCTVLPHPHTDRDVGIGYNMMRADLALLPVHVQPALKEVLFLATLLVC